MVKGQKETIKNKSFYIWMLSGALVVIGICAVCLNVGGINNKSNDPDLNKPFVENVVESQIPEQNMASIDNTQIADAQQAGEVNLLENDIVDDGVLKEDAEESKNTGKKEEQASAEEPEAVSVMGNNSVLDSLKFDEEAGLGWPASGNVIMNYSDNKMIYFATLGQYKINDAIMIGAEEGAKVVSAAKGVVTNISQNEETGVTLEMSIGGDYNLTYGQLKDLAVKKGDTVNEGQLIGYIAKPSKYYVVEGSNLYFKVTQDGKPVNPMYLLK